MDERLRVMHGAWPVDALLAGGHTAGRRAAHPAEGDVPAAPDRLEAGG